MSIALALGGCNTPASMRKLFVDSHNNEIGLPFYSYEKRGMHEVKISDTESEFIPDEIPPDSVGLVWKVDTHTRGSYHHPNGMNFPIEGTKLSWRIIGDPQKAMIKVNYWGGNW